MFFQDPRDSELALFNDLKTAFDKGALIVAAIAARTKEEIEESLDCGLVKGHAYAVSAVCTIDVSNPTQRSLTLVSDLSELPSIRFSLQFLHYGLQAEAKLDPAAESMGREGVERCVVRRQWRMAERVG